MIFCKLFLLIILFVISSCDDDSGWYISGNGIVRIEVCHNSKGIHLVYHPGLSPEEENKYTLYVAKNFPSGSEVFLKFDSDASLTLRDDSYARISTSGDHFRINFFANHDGLVLVVKGTTLGVIPYVKSLMINTREYCNKPLVDLLGGYLDEFILGRKSEATITSKVPDQSCGRRKVTHTELIVNGAPTKPGDWPWHVAIYRLSKSTINYICGGTLLSKTFVMTAAHCVTIRGVPVVPEILSVVLGKYNLIGGDVSSQEREVQRVIAHNQFQFRNLDCDIALLKLKTEVVFNDYIQPACVWYDQVKEKLSTSEVKGTVVGWGFDRTENLSPQLLQAGLPILPEATCLKSDPVFYGKILNDKKFCAGYGNGTSPCNGDSGGGFFVFVPDTQDISSKTSGAWYVRGIVSVTKSKYDVAVCDPEENVVFTDVARYRAWVQDFVNDIK